MRRRVRPGPILSGTFAALAALAVLVLVPPGYMLARGQGPTRLVICTGHGPVTVAADLGRSTPAKRGKPAPACAFAAHLGGAPVPSPTTLAAAWNPVSSIQPVLASQVAVGRGLAAPPPARAPPASL